MKEVNITIDGINLHVPNTYTILEAAKQVGVSIPTLCHLKDINEVGCCRMCLVEIEGMKSLQAACVYPVFDGMVVHTHNKKIIEARKTNLELILSNHHGRCQTCHRSWIACELQAMANKLRLDSVHFEEETPNIKPLDMGVALVRDPNKCILCRRCISVCKNVQKVGAIDLINRGYDTIVGSAFGKSLADTECVNCGQCVTACPVAAISERSSIKKVFEVLDDPTKHVIAQTAPAVRVALGESFGMPIGSVVTGKMVTALKMIGFDRVFDTDTGADLTVMEETAELIDRIRGNVNLPLITSCSPGWIKFCEHNYPEFLDNLSTCKSPHMMFGAILKSYYAKQHNIDPKDIVVVSIMPCTAKKYEIERPEMQVDGIRDVDFVLTTRELDSMIYNMGIDFANLDDTEFDNPFGTATGAGVIFGATGGVMEAALRTAADILTDSSSDSIEYDVVRGLEGIKFASVNVDGTEIRAAVVHGLANARKILDMVKAGEVDVHFIEMMACPGGCVTGGGQPIQFASVRSEINLAEARTAGLYKEDRSSFIRKSHNNPAVKKLYKSFLGMAGGTMSHKLLHTHYEEKPIYDIPVEE